MSIAGYEGLYEVSDAGRIRSKRRSGSSGGVLRPMVRPDGRMRVALSKNGVVTDFLLHRVVLEAFRGPCPEGMEACHSDDDPSNNNLSNLRWDTHANNVNDRRRNGKMRGAPKNTTHCRTGRHPWVPENIYNAPNGSRYCRECVREAGRRHYHKTRKAELDGS